MADQAELARLPPGPPDAGQADPDHEPALPRAGYLGTDIVLAGEGARARCHHGESATVDRGGRGLAEAEENVDQNEMILAASPHIVPDELLAHIHVEFMPFSLIRRSQEPLPQRIRNGKLRWAGDWAQPDSPVANVGRRLQEEHS